MVAFVKAKVPHGASVLDLYGSVGALTLPSAGGFRDITVVGSDVEAAQNLRDMIKWNRINNVHAVNSRAEDAIEASSTISILMRP
jgi:tRNA/tmRNA/rRNA uracil-C5-methylase (TrmA/RlmC/RlmD family)